jgi:hypothetical protein
MPDESGGAVVMEELARAMGIWERESTLLCDQKLFELDDDGSRHALNSLFRLHVFARIIENGPGIYFLDLFGSARCCRFYLSRPEENSYRVFTIHMHWCRFSGLECVIPDRYTVISTDFFAPSLGYASGK